MGWGVFPRLSLSTPRPIPCLSWMYNLKGFCKLDNPITGAETSFSFKVSNAAWQSLIHSRSTESSPFKELYNGFAIRAKYGFQIQQNPVLPKNPWSCLQFSGIFIVVMACFQPSRSWCPFSIGIPDRLPPVCKPRHCEVILYILFWPNDLGLWWCWANHLCKHC